MKAARRHPQRENPIDTRPTKRSATATATRTRRGTPAVDQALVLRARDGDSRAFEVLVRTHASFAYNVALRTLRDPAEAEDVAQEAFVRAWRALPRFREDGRFSTWLYRIVVNLCYDRAPRMRKQLLALPVDAASTMADRRPSPEAATADRELVRAVEKATNRLPNPYRMLLTLRHQQQLSYAEIAEIAGMPLGTVKTGIHRGRKRLRELLAEDGYMESPATMPATQSQPGSVIAS